MIRNLFDSQPKYDSNRIAAIKGWAADVFRLQDSATVFVTELRCSEPGCPPLETVIAVLDTPGKPRQHKIPKAIADVTFADVLALATSHNQE